jgi:hypothetical protein
MDKAILAQFILFFFWALKVHGCCYPSSHLNLSGRPWIRVTSVVVIYDNLIMMRTSGDFIDANT